MHTIVAIDVETTGLDPQNDYIVQLSAIKFNAETFDILGSINYMILHFYNLVRQDMATFLL